MIAKMSGLQPSNSSPYLKLSKFILVVEDSDEDFAALDRVLKRMKFNVPIYRVCDGEEALDYLYNQENYTDPELFPRPSIILLDLNLPGTDGREVIEQIKQDDGLKSIPVVVLTTSSNPKDIQACYLHGANSYMLKPMGLESLKDRIEDFLHYWLEAVILPDTDEQLL